MMVTLAARGGFDNPKSWSGTPFILKNELEKALGSAVPAIDWQINKTILSLYHRIYSRIFFTWGTSRDPLLHPLFKSRISSLLKNVGSERQWLMFVSDYCIPDHVTDKLRYAAYFDAFLLDFFDYIVDERLMRKPFIRHYERYNREYLSRMDVIFTQNEWTRHSITEVYNIDPDKIINVGFGINVSPLEEDKNYDEECILIVLRKGTERYKGLLLLLDAFKLVREKNPSVSLAVVGTDVGQGQPGVTCHYNQPRSVTEDLFRRASLYVMPALHEPNGITYLEALANKTPIIGLNRFAFPEFSGYGKYGFIVQKEEPAELADVILKALSDKKKLEAMGLQGQKFVTEHYRWNIVVGKMIKAMQEDDAKKRMADA